MTSYHPSSPDTRLHVLVVLGPGGHGLQVLRLIDLVGDRYRYSYVVADHDTISEHRIRVQGPVFKITQPRKKLQGRTERLSIAGGRIPSAIVQAWHIFSQSGCRAIIGAGPSLQIPIAIAARLRRIRHLYVDTASKVDTLSFTGRLIYRYHLADQIYVQWPHLLEQFPRARYAGRLL